MKAKFIPYVRVERKPSNIPFEKLEFKSPQEAVEYFNKKGYAFSQWNIFMDTHGTGQYESEVQIELGVFNIITDNWNELVKK
jgi:hypothetical protein